MITKISTCTDPPHHWSVTTTELDIYERCVKCQKVQSRPRFGQSVAKNLDESTRSLIREAHARLKAMREKPKGEGRRLNPLSTLRVGLRILTDEQVRAIRAEPARTSTSSLAKRYGVHDSTISSVRSGLTYQDVVG